MTPTKPAVIWHPSPNFNTRPDGVKPSVIALHHTGSGSAWADREFLCNPDSGVSAHYLISKDGTIHHLVKDSDRAWHAGKSAFQGREDVNDFSIGIELTNKGDGRTPFTEAQYTSCRALVAWLCAEYGIPRGNVVGHKDVALPKGRKDDPADNFDWERVLPSVVSRSTNKEQHMSNLKDQYGIKSVGEVGYEAYGNHAGPGGPFTTFDGRPMPQWDELSKTEQGRLTQARWETAAQAIL